MLHARDAQRRRMFQCAASSTKPLFMRHRRNGFVDQWHCCVLENASGISACIAHDDSAGNVRSFRVNPGQLHRDRVRKRLVTVVALDENWNVTRDWVHQVFRRKLRLGPFGFIPSAAQNPLAFRRLFHLRRDTFRELLRALRHQSVELVRAVRRLG